MVMPVQPAVHPSATPASQIVDLEDLAVRIEKAAYWTTEVARNNPREEIAEPLSRSVGVLRTVWSALRAVAMVLDTNNLEMTLQNQHQIRRVLANVGGTIASLSHASEKTQATMSHQLDELSEVESIDDASVAAGRLRTIAGMVKTATTEMRAELERSSSEIKGSSQIRQAVDRRLVDARQRALCGSLPHVLSRDVFDRRMEELHSRLGLFKCNLCLGVLEIDQLGDVTEEHGALIADALFLRVAEVVHDRTDACPEAVVGFYDDERLGIILPSCSLGKGRQLAEELRSAVALARWECRVGSQPTILNPTISLGVTQPCRGEAAELFKRRAESHLREAREQGGNTAVAAR